MDWTIDLDGFLIKLPDLSSGFVGVVLKDSAMREFTLSTGAGTKSELWLDDLTVIGLSSTPTPYYGTPTPGFTSYPTGTPPTEVHD
jgi:hypothetical protein